MPCDDGADIWEDSLASLRRCCSSSQIAAKPGFEPILAEIMKQEKIFHVFLFVLFILTCGRMEKNLISFSNRRDFLKSLPQNAPEYHLERDTEGNSEMVY